MIQMIQSNDSLIKPLKPANRSAYMNQSILIIIQTYLSKQTKLSLFIFTPYHTENTDTDLSDPLCCEHFLSSVFWVQRADKTQTPQNPSSAHCAARPIFSWQTFSETYPEVCWRCLELAAWLTGFPITLSNKIISPRKILALSLQKNDSTFQQ